MSLIGLQSHLSQGMGPLTISALGLPKLSSSSRDKAVSKQVRFQRKRVRTQGKPFANHNLPRRRAMSIDVGVLGENSKHIVGENGVRRFEEFRQYHAGWDGGRGRPLAPRSVTTLELFLRQLPELAALEPSLFLTHEGNLQLGWEDRQGNVRQGNKNVEGGWC